MENNQLYHHGTKGMRWGIRRYQNADGSLTPAGKKRYRLGKDGQLIKKKKVSRKVQKQRKENLEKARQAKVDKQQHEADRQKAILSGSAKEVMKFKGEFTKAEMDYIASRIQWEQNMANYSSKEITAGKSRVDKIFKGVEDITGKANTAIKAYNTVANIYNAINTNGMLPKIDTDINKGNRDQYKKHKKEKAKEREAQQRRAEQEEQKESKRAERAQRRESQNSENQSTTERYGPGPDDIIGEGNSRGSQSRNNGRRARNIRRGRRIINDRWNSDREWEDASEETIAIGQNYIAGLLEDHSR